MPSFDPALVPISKSFDVASDSARLVSEGVYTVFDAYCQLGLATMDAWMRAMDAYGQLLTQPEPPTAEIVRIRPRRA